MRKSELIVISIIFVSFILGGYLYPQMPEQVASHWNARGEVNGYMGRFWGVFLFPIILTGLFVLFMLIPRIDPLKENIEGFRSYYDGFIVMISLFLFYIFLLTILWNMGTRFNMTLVLVPAIGVLYYYLGVMLENARQNWFIGIRTPWTLSSEVVWKKTHRLGAKLFKAAGVLALFGVFTERFAIYFMVGPVLFASLYTIIYSYTEYQKTLNSTE